MRIHLHHICSIVVRAGSSIGRSVGLIVLPAACGAAIYTAGTPMEMNAAIQLRVFNCTASRHDLQAFERQLSRNSDLNARDELGLTMLANAATTGSAVAVEMLLSHGAAIDDAHPMLGTPLMMALRGRHSEIAHVLLARGANVDVHHDGFDALAIAVGWCDLECVRLVLDAGADPRAHGRRYSLLTLAVRDDSTTMLERVLALGIHPNLPDADGSPPLTTAVEEKSVESVRMLLRAGADPDQIGWNGRTPRAAALAIDCPEILTLLREYSNAGKVSAIP